ncbi:MAG: crosslink repair DNA glycosylase YcaQ family protein [Microthrixaceae bacterium]
MTISWARFGLSAECVPFWVRDCDSNVTRAEYSPDVPLEQFSAATVEWFNSSFPAPTEAQLGAWGPISRGENTLLCAPTGSGKTLAAFLWAIDRLGNGSSVGPGTGSIPGSRDVPASQSGVKVLYISPLRALAVDVEKNLRAPIRGVAHAAERLGLTFIEPTVGVRTGDTSPKERSRLVRHPPDILITTPESLYLMLTSAARESLKTVDTVIIDEIHALAPTKRGAHMALSLERLDHLIRSNRPESREPQRIGLSATQRPLEAVAGFLGGDRKITIVDAGIRKELDLKIMVPVEDMAAESTIWPSIHPELLRLIREHTSTLIFVNSRRLSERLAGALNELDSQELESEVDAPAGAIETLAVGAGAGAGAGAELVMAHHGSLSRERRLQVEDALKQGQLAGLVATSSLELGIDMGAVDLVVQVESPGSVASGLQRIGRAGHQVGAPSKGRIVPKHSADLLEAAVVAQRMRDGQIELTRIPANPLDVLAQQIVAACALDEWKVDDLFALFRRAANFSTLSRELFENTLDMLAGRYPAEEFAELRPRVIWDRIDGTIHGRSGAQRLAVVSGGTIPDRGLFGVFLPDGSRVGELDEEMVYESRIGQTFILGASTWRIEEITFERVVVTPAPGQIGTMPFWHGDGPGRDAELGAAVGAFVREIRADAPAGARERLKTVHALDDFAATNVLSYISEQADATGVVPDDRTIVIERFRDEIGDWRVCIHSPFGARVHAPWAMVVRSRIDSHFDSLGELNPSEVIWSDDGIVMRLPESADEIPIEMIIPDPDEMDEELLAVLPSTSAFAARFREAAARALLLPRRRPDQRTPLWQQRQRAADLLAVAGRYPSFPILLETTRECCNDVFDLPALRDILTRVRSRSIRVVQVETQSPSPFARSLLFGWIAVFMYEGDAPLAERRAAALSLDRELLRDLLGSEELRSLLDADVIEQVERELQRLTSERQAREADDVHDLLRVLGPLSRDEITERVRDDRRANVDEWISQLETGRRVITVTIGGQKRFAAAEDAGRLRDAIGVAVPIGLPVVFTESVERPLADLAQRFARTNGPFTAQQLSDRLAVSLEAVALVLADAVANAKLLAGEFRPGHVEAEFCDPDVLRRIRRRSLAALRQEVEPVTAATLTRFVSSWQGIPATRGGIDLLVDTIGRLQGAALGASTLEADILGSRIVDYQPADLDALCASGELVWVGAGAVGADDGRVRLAFRDQAAAIIGAFSRDVSTTSGHELNEPHHEVIRGQLSSAGASFWSDLVAATERAGVPSDERTVLEALWDLVWAGVVTADSFAPLRARVGGSRARRPSTRASSGARSRRGPGVNRRMAGLGPPAGSGRWSLVGPLLDENPNPSVMAMTRALQLIERYGVLSREMALAEGIDGGFAGVYPVLKLLEERGQIRRGYFVEGLGAAQFAQAGAVDLLRAEQDTSGGSEKYEGASRVIVLAATDPAQPYGAALRWPNSSGLPSRSLGAYTLIGDGDLVAYLERGGRKLLTFESVERHAGWANALAGLVTSGRVRRLQIATVDGESAATSRFAGELVAAGFKEGYRGLSFG